jgi:serine protease Do
MGDNNNMSVFTRYAIQPVLAGALATLLTGCATVPAEFGGLLVADSKNAEGVKNPRSYSFFFDQADHVKELLDAGQTEKAAAVFNDNYSVFFSKDESKYAPLATRLAAQLDKFYAVRFAKLVELLVAYKPGTANDWLKTRDEFAAAVRLSDEFSEQSAIRAGKKFQPEYESFLKAVSAKRESWDKGAAEAFTSFNHEENFFSRYPIAIANPSGLLDLTAPAMEQQLRVKDKQGTVSFYRTYKSLLDLGSQSKPSTAMAMVSNLYVEQALKGTLDQNRLRTAYKVLAEAKELGLTPTNVPSVKIAFAEATSATLLKDGQIEFPVSIDVDSPFAIAKGSLDDAFSGATASADYVVILDVAVANTRQRVAKRDEVQSEYLSGTRQVPNPEYEVARMSVYQAQSAFNQNQAEYCQGIACVVKGVAGIALATNLNQKRNAFQSTPMMLTESVYRDYQFNASDLTASRSVTANYYIVDKRLGTYFKSTFDLSEQKEFRLAYKLNEKDRNLSTHLRNYSTESDVKKFNEAPASIKLSSVLDQYVKSSDNPQPITSLALLRSELLTNKNKVLTAFQETAKKQGSIAKDDSRFESVVVVRNPKGSMGAGFFVAPDVVMTNYHVVEGSNFVEMKMYNGLDTFGKVIKSDVRLDLALIKVQTRGTPVTFFDGQVPLGATVEAIGHPKGLEFSISRGIVSAIRKRQGALGVGGKDVSFIQTDAPLNGGNSGGPLFLNGQVVGVNDWKFSQAGVEGISFSIHYTEAQEFFKEGK